LRSRQVVEYVEAFKVKDAPELPPGYNVAPTQPLFAVRLEDGSRAGVTLRWGLIPGWAEDRSIGTRLINARSETVATKPAFRSAFRRRRCLVLAAGFYEWQKVAAAKQPHYIRLKDGKPFAFAGLWEHPERDGEEAESCTIITTEANEFMRLLHDWLPLILQPGDSDEWLGPATWELGKPTPLLRE
jgi:putative SOS response-associated peptidase YedK